MKQKKSTIRFLRKAAKTDRRKPGGKSETKSGSSQRNEKKNKKRVRFSEGTKEDMLVVDESEPSTIQREEYETSSSHSKKNVKKTSQSKK